MSRWHMGKGDGVSCSRGRASHQCVQGMLPGAREGDPDGWVGNDARARRSRALPRLSFPHRIEVIWY